MVTAACCIIGDEILSGKTKDTNSHYLAKKLFDLGIELKSIQVVGDDSKDIQRCVRELSSRYDLVFTSGGIGPTHDDITYESVAAAFNLEMKLDPTTFAYFEKRVKKELISKYQARLCTFPHPARLIHSDTLPIPVVVVNGNIYILPGIPRLFTTLLDSLKLDTGVRFYRLELSTDRREDEFADVLTQIQNQYEDVKIGSYPDYDRKEVVVSVSGADETRVGQVAQLILKSSGGFKSKI